MERVIVDLDEDEIEALGAFAEGREADNERVRTAATKLAHAQRIAPRYGVSGSSLLKAFERFREETGGVDLDIDAVRKEMSDRPFPTFDE